MNSENRRSNRIDEFYFDNTNKLIQTSNAGLSAVAQHGLTAIGNMLFISGGTDNIFRDSDKLEVLCYGTDKQCDLMNPKDVVENLPYAESTRQCFN